MKEELIKALAEAVSTLGISADTIRLEYPEDPAHGDYSSNIAMANGKKLGMAPKALAEKIVAAFGALPAKAKPDLIESVTIAGPGFINFKVKDEAFAEMIGSVAKDKEYGWGKSDKGKKILVEHTDPNTYKPFHIGHLMATTIGESISRLVVSQSAQIVRLCYPSDVGLHIAKSLWAWGKNQADTPADTASLRQKAIFLGKMYVEGTAAYLPDSLAKKEIDVLNKVIYEKSDLSIGELYAKGRQWSLDYFESLYARFGTQFDAYLFESDMAVIGLEVVRSYLAQGVFEKSEGAIIFKGEQYGLHTRVFINSNGLPTYEAKEIGLNTTKFKRYPDTVQSIIVTGNEINEYFKVLLKALSLIDDKVSSRTLHLSHGVLRLASGKMSSRTGKVILAEDLVDEIKEMVAEKMSGRELAPDEANEISDIIAIGAIKYTILRQAIGGDVIFDSAASISFEGDSGPYLQYSAVRAASILEKAKGAKIKGSDATKPDKVGPLEKLIYRFPDIVSRARAEYAPQIVANYLIALAGAFNSFYAAQVIVDEKDPLSPYRVALTQAFLTTMTNGLWILGIKVPKKM